MLLRVKSVNKVYIEFNNEEATQDKYMDETMVLFSIAKMENYQNVEMII